MLAELDLQLINSTFDFHDLHFYGFSTSPQNSPLNGRSFHYTTTLIKHPLEWFDSYISSFLCLNVGVQSLDPVLKAALIIAFVPHGRGFEMLV